MNIANITILLIVEENTKEECYKLKSCFANTWDVVYALPETTEHILMSQFLILYKEGLLADNIDSQKIIKNIKRNHTENKNNGYVNTFLLEAIKAYDECGSQQMELRYLIENLSEWLYEQSKEDYIFLNVVQVKYKLDKLEKIDIEKIIDISSFNKDNIEILAGTLILLDKNEEAESLIEEMELEQKECFMSYPIYNLLENNKVD